MQIPIGTIKGRLMQYAAKLRYPKLLALTVGLFLLDLFIPDLVPWVDEILLALISLLLAGFKQRRTNDSP